MDLKALLDKVNKDAQAELGGEKPQGEVPLDPRLAAYLDQYDPGAPRNGLIELAGLPNEWKQTRKDYAEWQKNLPMSVGMGTMGTIGNVGKKTAADLLKNAAASDEYARFGKILMQEAAPQNLGKVMIKEAAPQNFGKVIMPEGPPVPRFNDLINRYLKKK